MDKKTIIKYVAIAVLLLGCIAAFVSFLYGGSRKTGAGRTALTERYELLHAVPSDAAALLCFDDLSRGLSLLNDRTKTFGALVCDGPASPCGRWLVEADTLVSGAARALRSAPMTVSLHHSGTLMPLVMVEASDSVSAVVLQEAASRCGLFSAYCVSGNMPVLLVSPSETLVHSSERHLSAGVSILSNDDFLSCANQVSGRDALFFSHTYASKLMQSYFLRPISRYSSFVKSFAGWTAFTIDVLRDDQLHMDGITSSGGGVYSYSSALASGFGGTPSFHKVAPSNSVYAVSLLTDDLAGSLRSYRNYLDAATKLSAGESARESLRRKVGISPDDWAGGLQIREVARVCWHKSSTDEDFDAVMVRVGSKDYGLIYKGLDASSAKSLSFTVQDYCFGGFVSSLFGAVFSLEDESCFTFTGEWLVIGSIDAVKDFALRCSEGDSLQSILSDTSCSAIMPAKASLVTYFSPGECKADKLFAPSFRRAIDRTFDGAAFEPMTLSMGQDGLRLDVRRVALVTKTRTPALVADATVDVPRGPFRVFNKATGDTCLIQQRDNYYLSFLKADGTGIWSVPFSGPLCGAVETIDYYQNGKSQFLFASGSNLYLLDRLGRFVRGFPADLGKEVLLGPSVYDFTGAGGYTVLVLHTDNTIGMFNLHGVSPASWQGIRSEDTIIALPELLEVGGGRYWIVRNAREALVYPFDGGEALRRDEGGKSIRRDSTFEVNDNGSVNVTCNDGKTRNIKL